MRGEVFVKFGRAFRSCVLCVGVAVVLVLAFSGASCAAFRYNRIEKVPGLQFGNLIYAWGKVELDVINITPDTRMFGGTMIFLDRRGRPLARASLLPKKITGLKSERYTAYFVEGSGEIAQHAVSVIWDFGTR
jgi:hypothetical protein